MRVARTRGRNKKTKVKYLILLIFLFAVIVTVADWIRISGYGIIPVRPAEKIDSHIKCIILLNLIIFVQNNACYEF